VKASLTSEPSRRERLRDATRLSLDVGQSKSPVTNAKKANNIDATMILLLRLDLFDFFNLASLFLFNLVFLLQSLVYSVAYLALSLEFFKPLEIPLALGLVAYLFRFSW